MRRVSARAENSVELRNNRDGRLAQHDMRSAPAHPESGRAFYPTRVRAE